MRCASIPAPASYLDRCSLKLVAAFAAVYVLWGGTYLGVRLGLETLPPFFLMAVRSVAAGAVLLAVACAWATPFPAWREWRATAILGTLFFVFCHGVLAYAQQRVPSGLAALLMATIPLWVPLISWVRPAGHPPSARAILTVSVGFAGVALLLAARQAPLTGAVEILYIAAVLFAAISWAVGMVVSRELALPASRVQTAGMELLIGGALLFIISMTIGEMAVLDLAAVSATSLAGLGYLILCYSDLAPMSFCCMQVRRNAPPPMPTSIRWSLLCSAGRCSGSR